jgi:hypothetical protein
VQAIVLLAVVLLRREEWEIRFIFGLDLNSLDNLFNNPVLQQRFLKEGYLVVDLPYSLIPDLLKQVYVRFCEPQLASGEGFYYSLMNEPAFNRSLQIEIKAVLKPLYECYFKDYEAFSESFLIKRALDKEELLLHQDWSYVNERSNFSITCWCPLEDAGPENGGLFLVPGSHLFFDNYRSCSLPTARLKALPALEDFIVPIKVAKGQAVFFHPAIFHGSYPNKEAEHRAVAASIVKPARALFQYWHQEEGQINRYTLSTESFLEELPRLSCGGKPLRFKHVDADDYHHDIPSLQDFLHCLKAIH